MQVGDWTLDSVNRTVSAGEVETRLQPRAWEVLLYLAERPGQVVSTEELLEKFWRGAISDASAVRKAVLEIRKALQDSSRSPRYIRTIPKAGYSLVAPVTGDALQKDIVLAVLPFDNMSGDPGNEPLCDGIAEEVINRLVDATPLKIVARNSSFQFKGERVGIPEIAARLGTTHLIEGSIRRQGEAVRVTVQLIDTDDGSHVFSRNFDHRLSDIFEFQDQVGQTVARTVADCLLPATPDTVENPTQNKVQNLYLRAQALLASEHTQRMAEGIELLEHCVTQDPEFLDAWLGIAVGYCELCVDYIGHQTPAEALPRAEAAAARALELVPDQPRAIGVAAWCAFLLRYDWRVSTELFERSTTLDPQDSWVNAAYCYYLRCLRDPNARMYGERAVSANQSVNFAYWVLAIDHLFAGREADAIRVIESADTTTFAGRIRVGLLHAFAGRFQVASQELASIRGIEQDHGCIRVLEYFVVQNIDVSDTRRIGRLLADIEIYAQSHYVPLMIPMNWPEGTIDRVWEQSLSEHQTTLPFYIFGDKPPQLSDACWQQLAQALRVEEADVVPTEDFLRTGLERAELYNNQYHLSTEEMDTLVGLYQKVGSSERLAIQRRKQELWLIDGNSGDYQLLIPESPDRFNMFAYSVSLKIKSDAASSLAIEKTGMGTTTTWTALT